MKIRVKTHGWAVNSTLNGEIDALDYLDKEDIEGKTAEEVIEMLYADQQIASELEQVAIETHRFEWSLEPMP